MKQGNKGRDPYWFTLLAYVGMFGLLAVLLIVVAIMMAPA